MSILIILSVLLAVFILTLSLSTYGLGREEKNQMSPAYKAATSFTMISVTGTIVTLILLILSILFTPKEITNRFGYTMNKAQ